MTTKLSVKEFVERSIKTLRKEGYTNIHVVFSGFNAAFRQYYGEDPRPHIDQLVKDGFLTQRPARGGVMIALASEQSQQAKEKNANTDASPNAALAKILSGM